MGYIGSGRTLKACVPLSQLVLQMRRPGHKSSLWGRVRNGPRRSSPLTEDIQSEQPTDAAGSLSLYKRSSMLLKTSTSGKCECIFKSAGQRLNEPSTFRIPVGPLREGKVQCHLWIAFCSLRKGPGAPPGKTRRKVQGEENIHVLGEEGEDGQGIATKVFFGL